MLAADELREDVAVLASIYLANSNRGRCRALRAGDLYVTPQPVRQDDAAGALDRPLRAELGASYVIEAIGTGKSFSRAALYATGSP